ncbi:DNA polymerase III, clamp loader complex, gamma/delta/delta subunit, C-terminal [Artemisia annua]|uniref:DNA polymerase III, clamp loader complex, gamma/delta/delta subunit, C-terminal n=1 Tax=Artemisia annua TaxID=35608 RepID=A0A2U1QBF0_ARTAN|nr:DNA polymerase III, clamp loader complex, gamma/delta/delta subunit, C-terminal [Artemisia annua]
MHTLTKRSNPYTACFLPDITFIDQIEPLRKPRFKRPNDVTTYSWTCYISSHTSFSSKVLKHYQLFSMKSPHVSPEPLNVLSNDISNLTEKASTHGSGKKSWIAGQFMSKKKPSKLTKENLEEFTCVEDKKYYTSPYWKGLLNTEKVANSFPPISHDLNTSSPYYKGLLNTATSPDRESQAMTFVSSSSKMSFSNKMQEWGTGCLWFKTKDEKAPTMIKVYSTEHSSNEESLRERGSDPSSPVLSPPLPTSSPPSLQPPPSSSPPPLPPSPAKRIVINAKDTSEPKEEKKYFWADKYRPAALKDFICNKDKAMELQKTICDEDCHHFIFEGQAGVGKRTMIWALLREAFGPDNVQARDEWKTFNLKGEDVSSIMVNVKESSLHVEVNLSELKGFEKHVIVELIKETNNLTNEMARCNKENCRAIILREADKLSTDALLYIRWVIERYRGRHKIFFCCQDASKLQPLKNICKVVQLLSPSNKEIVEVLEFIARKEEIELSRDLAERIAVKSKNNLRQAIRSFEATWQHNPLLDGERIILTGWENDIAQIAISIVEKQSPKQLYDIRRKLQTLIDHSVPPEFIFEVRMIKRICDLPCA